MIPVFFFSIERSISKVTDYRSNRLTNSGDTLPRPPSLGLASPLASSSHFSIRCEVGRAPVGGAEAVGVTLSVRQASGEDATFTRDFPAHNYKLRISKLSNIE